MGFVAAYRGGMAEKEKTQPLPVVSQVFGTTIVELVYDHETRTTAFFAAENGRWSRVADFVAPDGQRLVPYSASNNLIAHECVTLASEPASPGDTAQLLDDIAGYLRRYVDFSPLFERIAAHYILLSWVYDAFNEIPLLRLRGAFGSGKTRALIALGSIAYKGFFSSGASTVSPIFHTLDRFGGTLLLDEADLRFSDKTVDLVKILNNGTVRGLPVLRTLQNRNREFNPAAFSVYGPKIVAMRGTFRDQALESRFITEQMGQRPLRADIPIQLPHTLRHEALALRNRLLGFRFEQLFSVAIKPDRAVAGIDPRLNQMALPLLSLADDVRLREDMAVMLHDRSAALAADREENPEARVAAALTLAFAAGATIVPLHELARRANADSLGSDLSSRDIGRILRGLSVPLRKSHGTIVAVRTRAPAALTAS